MRRMLLTALAIATFVSSGILLQRAATKTHAPAPEADAKTTDAGFFQPWRRMSAAQAAASPFRSNASTSTSCTRPLRHKRRRRPMGCREAFHSFSAEKRAALIAPSDAN